MLLDSHLLPIRLPPRHRFPRLLDLLQHSFVAHVVSEYVCSLVVEADVVGGEACDVREGLFVSLLVQDRGR